MNKLKIFPSIGIARVGNSEDFFLCPEKETSLGMELDASGNEQEIKNFKSGNLVKKQGARFKIFEETANGCFLPFVLPAGAVIKWTVRLSNKKTATERTDPTIFFQSRGKFYPPLKVPNRIPLKTNAADLTIDSKDVVINQVTSFEKRKSLTGSIAFPGSQAKQVQLGAVFTDASQNLIVLGGNGRAEGKVGITNFYTNDTWFDDTSDGYIKAEISIPGTAQPIPIEGAWIIVAPTDYSPSLKGVVTLYDQLLNVAKSKFNFQIANADSFKAQILPLLINFKNIKWVEDDTKFDIPFTIEQLSNNSDDNKTLRKGVRDKILAIPLDGHPGNGRKFEFTLTQIAQLNDWVEGKFKDDYSATIDLDEQSGNYFTATALKTTVGQGFFPGIEGGVILCNPNFYLAPFTLDHSKLEPGDITGLMALPWQADFLECANNWWPTQRPYEVRPDANDLESVDEWQRPMGNDSEFDGANLVKNIHRLAFIKAKQSQNGIVFVEEERDPTLKERSDLLT